MIKRFSIACFFLFYVFVLSAQKENPEQLIQKGWAALVKDEDTTAIQYFEQAYELAVKKKDTENTASALLHLGISYYGISQTKGLEYCSLAMAEYGKLEKKDPGKALAGRSRCLQLLSTIYSREGKYPEVIHYSHEALAGFPEGDTSGYRGLIFLSLGKAYENTGIPDSAEYYKRRALAEQLRAKNFVYQPAAYLSVADIELGQNKRVQSDLLYKRAFKIADSTGNLQAKVLVLLGMGKWQLQYDRPDSALFFYEEAQKTAAGLKDKVFYLQVLEQLVAFKKQQGNYPQALAYEEEAARLKDSLSSYEREKLLKSLEVQFNVAEKDRQLTLLQKEKAITQLSNYLLWASVAFILLLSASIIVFLRKSNARNKVLLHTKEELVIAIEEKNKLREQFLQNELEFKESQVSAMALQVMQKNNLVQEIKEKVEQGEGVKEPDLKKILSKGLSHDKEWADFNTSFESVNRNFYLKLREAYPGISPNDLKICALIKLNLSIKEMAGILNISPDSVKTARYRLRKKLQLNTEDSLSEFILKLQ